MKIELNCKEYTYIPCSKHPKCFIYAWKALPTYRCLQFCRPDYIFRTIKITSSIFHL